MAQRFQRVNREIIEDNDEFTLAKVTLVTYRMKRKRDGKFVETHTEQTTRDEYDKLIRKYRKPWYEPTVEGGMK